MYTGSLEPFSNRADWTAQFRGEYKDPDDGSIQGIDLTGCAIVLALSDDKNCGCFQGGTATGEVTLLEYSTGELSVISWTFDASKTRGLCAGSYNAGMTIASADQTVQLFIGAVAVLQGNVP